MPISHRDEEYDSLNFKMLSDMQEQHFWYRGRHRFLFGALDRYIEKENINLSCISSGCHRAFTR